MGRAGRDQATARAVGSGAERKRGALRAALKPMISPRRQRILEAMLEVVGADGYDATSVRTVLDRTGLYRQAFYDNFPDKETCYLEAFDAGVARLEARCSRPRPASRKDGRRRLRAGLAALAGLPRCRTGGGPRPDRRCPHRRVRRRLPGAKRRWPGPSTSSTRRGGRWTAKGLHGSPPRESSRGSTRVLHLKLATGRDGGFRELLPELMYFAVLPYFGPEAAGSEMGAGARA